MANYRVEFTTEDVKWPAYVSAVPLEGDKLQKAESVLDEALVTLETYGGPRFIIANLKSAKRTGIFLYEICCALFNLKDEKIECVAKILYEPWMKANSIAAASFEFKNDENVNNENVEKLVMKRKKSIKYYKDNEMIYEERKNVLQRKAKDIEETISQTERVTDV